MTFARTAAKLLARAMVRALRLISACALEVATRLHNAATTCDGRAPVFVVTAAAQGVHHRFITEAFEVHTISTPVLPATFHESEMRCIALKRMLTFMYHARQFSEECSPAVCTAVSQAIDHLTTVTRILQQDTGERCTYILACTTNNHYTEGVRPLAWLAYARQNVVHLYCPLPAHCFTCLHAHHSSLLDHPIDPILWKQARNFCCVAASGVPSTGISLTSNTRGQYLPVRNSL